MQDFARLGFQRVAAEVFVFFLDFAEAFEDRVHFVGASGIFHCLLEGFELMMEVADAAAAGYGFVEHGAAAHLFHVLAEVADGELLAAR